MRNLLRCAVLALALLVPAPAHGPRQRVGGPWNKEALAALVDDLRDELASARAEAASLRRENHELAQTLPPSKSKSALDEDVHGRTLFITMCAGTQHFDVYCGPMLASFERAYGAAALKHEVLVFIANIEPRMLEAARSRFAPWVKFVNLENQELRGGSDQYYNGEQEYQDSGLKCTYVDGKFDACTLESGGLDKRDFKTTLDSLWFPMTVSKYLSRYSLISQNKGFIDKANRAVGKLHAKSRHTCAEYCRSDHKSQYYSWNPASGDNCICAHSSLAAQGMVTDNAGLVDEECPANDWCTYATAEEHYDSFCYAVILDSDLLFVRPLDRFLPACDSAGVASSGEYAADWDVAFTVYDHNFTTPWAKTASDVGRTRQLGLTRLNCGVVLVSLRDPRKAARFLWKWAFVSAKIVGAGSNINEEEEENQMWKYWQGELIDELRGNDQVGLASLVASFDMSRVHSLLSWDNCQVCERTVDSDVRLFTSERPLRIRFRALPARILNHAESIVNGTFPSDLLIVHMKGLWWRYVLPKASHLFETTTRKAEWNRDALDLHKTLYIGWQLSLPSDVTSDAFKSPAIFDREGNNVTEEFLTLR